MMKSINAKIENLSPFNYKLLLVILNVFFAILACVGQVGQNVSLPLWAGAVSSNCSYYRNNSMEEIMDSYFILSFASFSFILIFGLCTLVVMIFNFNSIKRSISFPQWQLLLIGVSDAFNGILVVFSAMPFRTAPFLQAILGNITIPLTIVLRLLILRKKPTLLKLIAAGIVVVGLILSLIPTIGGFDKDNSNSDWLQQSTASRILWPFCFMIGFVPAVLMNVFEEKSLKDTRNVNMFYLLFCTSIYQFLTVANFFYLDIVPGFGFASSLEEFGAK
jgi:drug/metabolite transporter (DMT)-like permease